MIKAQNCLRLSVNSEIELKQLELSDAKIIFKTIDNQRGFLGKWLPFIESTKDIDDTIEFVKSVTNAPAEQFEFVFAIFKFDTFAGLIGFKDTDRQNKRTEIGYWLSEPFQKQGIIIQSAERLCKFAFQELDINRIQIKAAVENLPSKNIAQRLGFAFEGVERQGIRLSDNSFADIAVFSKLRND